MWRTNDRLKRFCSLTDIEIDDIINILISDEVIQSAYKDKWILSCIRAVVLDICLSFMPIMTFCETKYIMLCLFFLIEAVFSS